MSRGRRWKTGLALAVLASTATACASSDTPEGTASTQPQHQHDTGGGPVCPLTGTPAPGGAVPHRPALAVKVDNYVQARPQSGLDASDIVFEEPVEGGITRYVAVFQCQGASSVGPIRSARNIDIGILGQFGRPLLVNVGGISPVLENIEHSTILENDLRLEPAVVQNPPGRTAPYDTYADTSQLWALHQNETTPPAPVFNYSQSTPTGTANASVAIAYPGSDVTWRYDPTSRQYLRFYGAAADVLADGTQNSAANVIVQTVQVTYGPWLENDVGGLEVQANLYEDAGGSAEVFRDGVEIAGRWQRSALGQPTQFVSADGTVIQMAPGRTWVELVPTTTNVTVSP